MITGILPIRIIDNLFWGSSAGIESIERFLEMVSLVEGIDHPIVVTPDDIISRMAGQYGMTAIQVDSQTIPDGAYTFKAGRSLAKKVFHHQEKQFGGFIVLDHRNLLLTADDISMAISIHEENSHGCVLSLSLLKDHPCQYKTFSSLMGCTTLYFRQPHPKDTSLPNILPVNYAGETTCMIKGHDEVTINLVAPPPCCRITFGGDALEQASFICHLIPFDGVGPRYQDARDFHIPPLVHDIRFDIECDQLIGLIIIFTSLLPIGEYDTVEIFTPPKAPWKLSDTGSTMISLETNRPMFGRQQFPTAYTYDGSICIFNSHDLKENAPERFIPFYLENSFLVNDWVDYYYTTTTQIITDNSKK